MLTAAWHPVCSQFEAMLPSEDVPPQAPKSVGCRPGTESQPCWLLLLHLDRNTHCWQECGEFKKVTLCYYIFSFFFLAWSIEWHINIITIPKANVTSGVQSGDLFIKNVFWGGCWYSSWETRHHERCETLTGYLSLCETPSEKCALAQSRHEILMFVLYF